MSEAPYQASRCTTLLRIVFLWNDFGKFIIDNPIAFAFKDSLIYSQTVANRTWMVGRWAKNAPTTTQL